MEKYEKLLCSKIANLARILDPRFSNDILEYVSVVRKFVELPI